MTGFVSKLYFSEYVPFFIKNILKNKRKILHMKFMSAKLLMQIKVEIICDMKRKVKYGHDGHTT